MSPNVTIQGESPNQFYINANGTCVLLTLGWPLVPYPPDVISGMVVFVVSLVFIWSTLLWYFTRRNHSYLKKRAPFLLLVLMSIGGSLMAVTGLGAYIANDWPCAGNLLYLIIVPLWIGPLIVRIVAAVNRARFYDLANSAPLTELDEAIRRLKSLESPREALFVVVQYLNALRHGVKISPLETAMVRGVLITQFLTTLAVLPFVFLMIGEGVNDPSIQHGCKGCSLASALALAFAISSGLLIIVFLIILFVFRNARDPLGELHEIRISVVIVAIFAGVGQIVPVIVDVGQGNTFEYITLAGYLLVHFTQVCVPAYVTMRRWKSSSSQSFNDVMQDPALKAQFVEFTKKEMSYENIRFLDEVIAYRETYPHDDPETRLIKARRLLNSMIVDGSALQINISSSQRISIEKRLASATTRDDLSEVFDEAYVEVTKLIERDSYGRFRAKMMDATSVLVVGDDA
jgi:hypothetical protein